MLAVQKAYLANRGLRGVYKGGIGSYSLALMALHSMQQAAAKSAGAEGGSGAGDDDAKDAKILGDSLLQFLEMYGHTVDLTKASIKVHALKPGKGKKAAEAHEAARKADWGVLPAPTSGDGPARRWAAVRCRFRIHPNREQRGKWVLWGRGGAGSV